MPASDFTCTKCGKPYRDSKYELCIKCRREVETAAKVIAHEKRKGINGTCPRCHTYGKLYIWGEYSNGTKYECSTCGKVFSLVAVKAPASWR